MLDANELIKSEWYKKVLHDVNFYEYEFPESQIGYLLFLMDKNILFRTIKSKSGWMFIGFDKNDNDIFTEDFNYYEDFNTCVNTLIVECMCYLANKKK